MKTYSKDSYKSCYFVMETREMVRENEEMHNFYGRRTNRFLLQSYNFVMANNQYDSFGLRLYSDPTISVKPTAVEKLIGFHNKKTSTQKSIKSKMTR